MITVTTIVLQKLRTDTRTLDERIADHINSLNSKGAKIEAKNRLEDGSLVKYEVEIVN
ncbi:MAG: hypothetical protein H7196_01005 [candidate division SR1 bacterium]|nr:hypothetical protein [candidate division SR1 bacterium]